MHVRLLLTQNWLACAAETSLRYSRYRQSGQCRVVLEARSKTALSLQWRNRGLSDQLLFRFRVVVSTPSMPGRSGHLKKPQYILDHPVWVG